MTGENIQFVSLYFSVREWLCVLQTTRALSGHRRHQTVWLYHSLLHRTQLHHAGHGKTRHSRI